MPNLTSNFSFNKPLVNDPIDEDLWGGQLNSNWDSVDTILDALTPIGTVQAYTDTSAPNSRWLLAYGQAVSRTTYSALFSLVSTSFGAGDGSTTFNLPDCRGRSIVGLDNLGGSSADRITDANADSLNNTGVGSQTDAGTNGSVGSTTLTASQVPDLNIDASYWNSSSAASGQSYNDANRVAGGLSVSSGLTPRVTYTITGATNGGGGSHTHTGSTWTGATGANVQPSIAMGAIIRVL